MTFFSDDLDPFFADFGEPIDWNGQSLVCIFNNVHDPLSLGASGRLITATVKLSDFPGVMPDEQVVIRGASYSIAEINPIQDGNILKLFLEEA